MMVRIPTLVTTSVLIGVFAVASAAGQKALSEKPLSEAEKNFTQLKALAGNWEAAVTTEPPSKQLGNGAHLDVQLRVNSMGNALALGWREAGRPNPMPYELTVFYLDSDRLLLTHYCDAGNRPRMVAKTTSDGKTLSFDFLDIAGPIDTPFGYLHHAALTFIDENHHSEDWYANMPGDKRVHAHFDLQRIKEGAGASAN